MGTSSRADSVAVATGGCAEVQNERDDFGGITPRGGKAVINCLCRALDLKAAASECTGGRSGKARAMQQQLKF